jgi:hypothetical protein
VTVERLRLSSSKRLAFHVRPNQQRNPKTLRKTSIASLNATDQYFLTISSDCQSWAATGRGGRVSLTQEAIYETIKSHLPVGNVTGNDYSGIKIRIPYLSHGRQIMYDVRDGDGTSLCVYISG